MDTRVRNLYYQIMTAIANAEGLPEASTRNWITQVTSITQGVKGMKAIRGVRVEPGLTDVPVRSGVYLAKTFHRRGSQEIAIYNICVMDKAGDIRLLIDTRADSRTPSCTTTLRKHLTDLVAEHDKLNHAEPPPTGPLVQQLENTAELLQHLRPDRRAGWIIYLLEILDDSAMSHSYELFLQQTAQAIKTRLLTGCW